MQNEVADALSDESIKTIVSAMNGLPDDVLSYVMAYTEASCLRFCLFFSFLVDFLYAAVVFVWYPTLVIIWFVSHLLPENV